MVSVINYYSIIIHNYAILGAQSFQHAKYGEGTGSIWIDDVYCTGNETRLVDCSRGGAFGVHNCDHHEDASVRCQFLTGIVEYAIYRIN